jgi:hypothetical protein
VTEQQSFQNTVIIEDISNNLFSNTASTSTNHLSNYSTVRPSPLEVGHKKYGNYKPMERTIEVSGF